MVHGSSADQIAIVEKALSLGVNVFDTSAAYGKGAAEVNLGRVLKDIGAREAIVMTKALVPPSDLTRIAEKVAESLDDSLIRLRRSHVDVLLLHNPVRVRPNPDNPLITALSASDVLEQAIPAMVTAREQGKARFLGMACDESETAAVIPVLESGEFAMVNFTYNLANPSAALPVSGISEHDNFEGLFAAAQRNGTWVAVVRPLAGGALASAVVEKGTEGLHGLSRGYFRMLPQVHVPMIANAKCFRFLDRPPEQSLAQAAWRYILGNPLVSTVIGGFSDAGQLEEAVAASEAGPLSGADLAAISAVHARGFD
jgi:aryl-alcohol dehydrogenase-like predicted oxidoreductase